MKLATQLLAFILLATPTAAAAVSERDGRITVSGERYAVVFNAANGSILSVRTEGGTGAILRSGEHGLWHVRFHDGAEINAAAFNADSTERSFRYEVAGPDSLRMTFSGPDIAVVVTVTGRETAVDFSASVKPAKGTILDFALPARLRFDADSVERFVFPIGGNHSVGVAFRAPFFKRRDEPVGWRRMRVGPEGHKAVYGGPLDERPYNDPPTAVHVTDEGRKWLGADLAARVDGGRAVVNRPPTRAQADLVLVDSPKGPYFSACRLGGKGLIWRIGGTVGMLNGRLAKHDVADMVTAVINKLAASRAGKLGVVALSYGAVTEEMRDWVTRLRACPALRKRESQVVVLAGARQVMESAKGDEFFAILNTYGECIPVPEDGGIKAMAEAIRRYVRAGGNWFEVSGYPFYYELYPIRFFSIRRNYPNAFADFLHLDSRAGSVSLYGVQPQKWPPWEGARNKAAIFVPARLGCGGDERGGYGERFFATYVAQGDTWQSPTVRMEMGKPAVEALRAYCKANEFKRKLEEKMPPALLERFKKSVVLCYPGSCRDKIEALEYLPVPTFLFFADYLKGGFDKEYPDHLPPRPEFGTPEEFRAFIARAQRLGHMVMPYTNPTWWCDHPRGPTFKREGEAPLLRTLDGKLSYESYGPAKNDGYTVCHWHPAVQAANRKTVRRFTEDYPVDVLFEDQCGARSWRYDMNPASPAPYAYFDGLISQVAEDFTKGTPLSTEGGCDRLVNYECQFSGLSFDLVPLGYFRRGIRLMKEVYPPETWEIFPVALYIAHDKVAMIHHFIQYVRTREILAWTMGLGFSLNYSAAAAPSLARNEWFKWLDRVQKSVCARYVGEPLRAFEHEQGAAPTRDGGVLRAAYDRINVIANVGPNRRAESGHDLAPYGFYVTGPGLTAGNLKSLGGLDFGDEGVSFVAEGDDRKADVWVYAAGSREVCVELPARASGNVSITLDGKEPVSTSVAKGVVRFRLPARPGAKGVEPPAALVGKAPRDWPGGRPAIGILDLGEGIKPACTQITPEEWFRAFADSALARRLKVPVKRIASFAELEAALKAGGVKWLAVVNPYGENFPASAPGKWRETLNMIRDYVNNGGCWWETGGYSFYYAYSPSGDGWRRENVFWRGTGFLGVPVGGGDVDEPPQRLSVPPEGREWLGEELTRLVEKSASMVNRGLPRGPTDQGHVTLAAGEDCDFIGGYRLDGWGWLWRIGGFSPNRDVVLPVAVKAMEYIYTHPPLPVKPGEMNYLWHAVVEIE